MEALWVTRANGCRHPTFLSLQTLQRHFTGLITWVRPADSSPLPQSQVFHVSFPFLLSSRRVFFSRPLCRDPLSLFPCLGLTGLALALLESAFQTRSHCVLEMFRLGAISPRLGRHFYELTETTLTMQAVVQ